jgi:hypothetical protein
MTRNNVGCKFHLIFYTMQRCLIGSLPVMKHVFNTSQKTTEHAVENTEFTSDEKSRMSRSQFKTMLVCFFDHKGIVHINSLTRTNGESTVLFWSVAKVTGICSEEKTQTLAWQADSPPRVGKFLANKSITKMDHPPYSPDLAPCDFWLFPKLKNAVTGQSGHPMQRDVTARYSEKRLSRLFPAVAPLSCEAHSITRRVFWRWQLLLVHM